VRATEAEGPGGESSREWERASQAEGAASRRAKIRFRIHKFHMFYIFGTRVHFFWGEPLFDIGGGSKFLFFVGILSEVGARAQGNPTNEIARCLYRPEISTDWPTFNYARENCKVGF
jgi:hypothetical protein